MAASCEDQDGAEPARAGLGLVAGQAVEVISGRLTGRRGVVIADLGSQRGGWRGHDVLVRLDTGLRVCDLTFRRDDLAPTRPIFE